MLPSDGKMRGQLVFLFSLMVLLPTLSMGDTTNFCLVKGGDYYDKQNDKTIKEYFECPGPEDPADHTICCDQKCCPLRHIDSVMKVDIGVAMAISLTVIIVSVTTGIILIVCCFISSCPLYDTCAGGYKKRSGTGDILPFGEYDNDGRDTDPLTNGVKNNPKYYATSSDLKIKITKPDHV